MPDVFDDSGNGLVTQLHKDYEGTEEGWKNSELRFVGPNPKNYVEFNEEEDTWRIIGLVNVKTERGIEQRVKIIRDSIGSYSWDTSEDSVNGGYGINEWSQSDIMKLLNPGYDDEDSNNSLYWKGESGTCYNNSNNSMAGCDFSSTGGLSKSESYISDDIIWNTGTNGKNDYKAHDKGLSRHFYEYERSKNYEKICKSSSFCNDVFSRTTEWKTEGDKKALVGLMYPSDYGYAVGGEKSNRTDCLDTAIYDWGSYSNCKNNNWLFTSSYQWTMSPNANASYASVVFAVIDGNYAYNGSYAYSINAIRPVVYLKSNVKIYDGDGSQGNNFKLQIEQ